MNQLRYRPVQHLKMTVWNLSFVKDIYVDGRKLARNDRKTAICESQILVISLYDDNIRWKNEGKNDSLFSWQHVHCQKCSKNALRFWVIKTLISRQWWKLLVWTKLVATCQKLQVFIKIKLVVVKKIIQKGFFSLFFWLKVNLTKRLLTCLKVI